jgi:hypothetical protein
MALAAFDDLLARVEASRAAAFGGLHRLTVDDALASRPTVSRRAMNFTSQQNNN